MIRNATCCQTIDDFERPNKFLLMQLTYLGFRVINKITYSITICTE